MILQKLEQKNVKTDLLDKLRSGNTVEMSLRIKEGGKERLQSFQGVVVKLQGRGTQKTVTVRKMSSGIGVEKTIPVASPFLESVKLISEAKVRQSRLFYIRALKGRSSRLKTVDRNLKKEN